MSTHCVPVGAYRGGELVQRFGSVRDACQITGIKYANMQHLLNTGKRHAADGLVFKRLGKRGRWAAEIDDDAEDSGCEDSGAAQTLASWRPSGAADQSSLGLLMHQGQLIRERDVIIEQQRELIRQQNMLVAALVAAAAGYQA